MNRIVSLIFCITFAAVSYANEPSGASWLRFVPDASKRQAISPGLSEVAVDITTLFKHGHGETRVVALTPERSLAITGLRLLDGADGTRTWVGMHTQGGAEHNVFITAKDGYVYGTVYASDTVYEIVGDTTLGAVRLTDQKAAGHTLAPPSGNDFIVPPLPLVATSDNIDELRKAGDIVTFATPAPQSVIDLLFHF